MKTLFSMGFQPYDPFTIRHPLLGQAFRRGLTADEIDQYTAKITAGRQKLARINAWLESKRGTRDWVVFEDETRNALFFNYLKTANSDEPSVERVWNEITNPTTASYEVAVEDIIRTNNWANMINYMTIDMEDAQKMQPVAQPGRVTQGPIDPRTGRPVIPTTKPGMMPTTTAQTQGGGIPTGVLLLGGGAIAAAIALAALLKA